MKNKMLMLFVMVAAPLFAGNDPHEEVALMGVNNNGDDENDLPSNENDHREKDALMLKRCEDYHKAMVPIIEDIQRENSKYIERGRHGIRKGVRKEELTASRKCVTRCCALPIACCLGFVSLMRDCLYGKETD